MSNHPDVVVIGAGVIGAATALELARKGYQVLCLDKLPASGYGATSNSCAIIRMHYSTVDGAAIAYEGYFYWKNWGAYLEVPDERSLARFYEVGCMVSKTDQNDHLRKHSANMDSLGIPYEEWDNDTIRKRLPIYDLTRYGPPRPLDDPDFGKPRGGEIAGACFYPTAGYMSDPQLVTHNLQRAAEARGATFRFGAEVVEIPKQGGRVAGVVLADGTRIAAPIVVNVCGPHAPGINALVGADVDMKISIKPLKQEVVHLPCPEGFDFQRDGFVVSDGDIGCYSRPEAGNHLLVGSEDPECDERVWVDPDHYDRGFTDQGTVQAHRAALRIPRLPIPHRLRGVVDLYDVTDDWIPIYDKSAVPGFYMAAGTSGNQFKNAPVVGILIDANLFVGG